MSDNPARNMTPEERAEHFAQMGGAGVPSKPLHVQVAEALGWTSIQSVQAPPVFKRPPKIKAKQLDTGWYAFIGRADFSACPHPHQTAKKALEHAREVLAAHETTVTTSGLPSGETQHRDVPHYDTDWSATGPLIEKHRIDLRWGGQNLQWWAGEHGGLMVCSAPTPLLAVCNLILTLAWAGKL